MNVAFNLILARAEIDYKPWQKVSNQYSKRVIKNTSRTDPCIELTIKVKPFATNIYAFAPQLTSKFYGKKFN